MGKTDGNLAALAAHLSRHETPRPGDACEFCDGALEVTKPDEDCPRCAIACDTCGDAPDA